MPALPDVPKVLRCALRFDDGRNHDIVTRFYEQYSGAAPDGAEALAFATSIASDFDDRLASEMVDSLTLIEVEVSDLSSPTGAQAAFTADVAGTRTGDPVAIDSAVVVSYEISRRYRGGHARGYWPFGVGGDLDSLQTWADAFVAEVQSQVHDFFADIAGDGWSGAGTVHQVNVSYYTGFSVVIDPLTGRARNVPTTRATPVIDDITSRVTRKSVGTQRRRVQFS